MELRNALYSSGIKPSYEVDIPVISVGNLSVGGTGKTPFIEMLLGMATDSAHVSVLARGYGRRTRGLLELSLPLDAQRFGDEPSQIKTLYSNSVVVVSEDRAAGYRYLAEKHPELRLILLDDAYQNLRVRRTVNIMLTPYDQPFFRDLVLPAGNLREFRKNASRADLIVVTKGPEQPDEAHYTRQIRTYAPSARIVFSKLGYGPLSGTGPMPDRAMVVSSIAEPEPLYTYLKQQGVDVVPHALPDHATYTEVRLVEIGRILAEQKLTTLLTTTKDAAKLEPLRQHPALAGVAIRVVPVAHTFYHDADVQFFQTLIASYA